MFHCRRGWVAQLVEQWTENPRVGGSIPPPATSSTPTLTLPDGLSIKDFPTGMWTRERQKGRFGNRPSLCSYAEMDMTGEPIALRTRRTRD